MCIPVEGRADAFQAATPTAAETDSRIAELCGSGHVNEAASRDDVCPNPAGFYVTSLGEQVCEGDPRIVLSPSSEFYLCTRPATTPDKDRTKALLMLKERTAKYLFVPVIGITHADQRSRRPTATPERNGAGHQ